FNETKRLGDCIYNNMKGRIVGIELLSNNTQIQFDVELEVPLNPLTDTQNNFTVINSVNGHSVIRFIVDQTADSDQDNDSSSSVVPFQVAYAVSIHKAQGLEYKSVKVVIASEIGEQITHNIFYTAITRAREKLKIYWSPECERKVLSEMKIKDCKRDFHLLRQEDRLKNLQ
ncbi:MAG: ATP-binding domain-containing protein, partial [Lentisphaeria bacterium]|nr:ATP-binding domain-containing protein [Lentisphaeria bacterium]